MDKDIINRKIGAKIKKTRKENNMTLLELANKVGLSEGTVQRYESGNISNVAISALENFAKALGTSSAYLMGWDSQDNAPELTQKDEREIESDLEDMMNSVSSAAYEGDGDIEDMEAFKATIKAAMMVAKKIAKKKYTPKKYRKD
ncbi:helix-turn-helix domain-containing protein [Dialister invisus]|uniref:helix-turn-helix domain-containing protein n=1 Tax=Dialister invisus TaxID=218538 RepID=UPI0023F13BAC|nr:helix-turn-helix domain-containing protein [Dialister invisus]